MILEMKVPSPGESITEVEIATWLVKDGDYVEKDQAIAEVGEVVCLIDTSAKKPSGGGGSKSEAAPKAEAKETPKEEKKAPQPVQAKETYASGVASPAAKKIIAEKGMEASAIKGTGKDGRITKEDAVQAVPSMGSPTGGKRGESRSKLSMLRRKVAERLVSVKNETAMLTTFNEVDMSPIFDLRNQFNVVVNNTLPDELRANEEN